MMSNGCKLGWALLWLSGIEDGDRKIFVADLRVVEREVQAAAFLAG